MPRKGHLCYNHDMFEGPETLEVKEKTDKTIAPGLGDLNLENVSEKKRKAIEDLIDLGKNTGNELEFIDYGGDPLGDLEVFKKSLYEEEEVKLNKEVLEGLNEDEISSVKICYRILKSYFFGPLFTDNLPDHVSRRKWESEYIEEKTLGELRTDVSALYKANRLGESRSSTARSFLSLLIDTIKNTNIKNQISALRDEAPRELTDQANLENTKENFVEYHFLSKEEKVRIVKKFTDIAGKVLDILEDKNIKLT